MNCNNIILDNLSLHIDIDNNNSYNPLLETAESMTRWRYSKTSDMVLRDYGLNQYDLGKTNNMLESKNISKNTNVVLEPISYYNSNGTLNIPLINHVIDINVGNYLNLTGGYLNGVFKYQNYGYELLPRRFNNGITIETTILVSDESIIDYATLLYMGTRATDKYNINDTFEYNFTTAEGYTLNKTPVYLDVPFYGEIKANLKKDSYKYNSKGIYKLSVKPILTKFFVYVNDIILPDTEWEYDRRSNQIKIKDVILSSSKISIFYYVLDDPSIVLYDVDFDSLVPYVKEENFSNSIFSLDLAPNRQLGLTFVENNNSVKTYFANKRIKNGWNHIAIRFVPYKPLIDMENTMDDDCQYENRLGYYCLYLNGIEILKLDNMKEIIFNGLENDRSRQIGLPYNISWGGGSFGLKRSFIFNETDPTSLNYNPITNDGLIEKYFDNNFIGGLQVLRIYSKSLSYSELRNNYTFEANKLGIKYNRGGRIINT